MNSKESVARDKSCNEWAEGKPYFRKGLHHALHICTIGSACANMAICVGQQGSGMYVL